MPVIPQEAEVRGSQVKDQSWLYSEFQARLGLMGPYVKRIIIEEERNVNGSSAGGKRVIL